MDSKFYVSYEAARLLKEKGYNEETEYTIDNNGRIWMGEYRDKCDFPCPTKVEAIDWLEGKGFIVNTKYYSNRETNRGQWSAQINRKDSWAYMALGAYYLTRLEAEEAAIIKALKLL